MNTIGNNTPEIRVSVCMIAYNHEAYVAQAVEGILAQQTSFPVELVIGEDCSTDSTRSIVQNYADRYPDRIRLILQEQNVGLIRNFHATVTACHGKYVALCDSDDYWTDPLKLQKQVDFLEAHPECVICYHPAFILNMKDQTLGKPRYRFSKDIAGIDELLSHNLLQTSTVIFRNGLITHFPDWYFKTIFNDWSLHLLNAEHGKIGYIDEYMAIYRSHPTGMWTSRSNLVKCQTMVDFFFLVKDYFGRKYSHIINRALAREYIYMSAIFAEQGDLINSKTYFQRSISTNFFLNNNSSDQLAMLMRLYFPWIYRSMKRALRARRST